MNAQLAALALVIARQELENGQLRAELQKALERIAEFEAIE